MKENKIYPIRLHLEVKSEYLSDHQKMILKRYGESKTGESISRDILIPSDMPLHNLHYAIQKLFGWTNSHLRSFNLTEDVYSKLTKDTVKGWSDLVGVLFQPPSAAQRDIFWDDDYESGSINAWLKRKYSGPYRYGGYYEKFEAARKDVDLFLNHISTIEVRESVFDYMKRKDRDNSGPKIIKTAALIDLTLEEMNSSIMLEGGTKDLMESLIVDQVLASKNEKINDKNIFPVCNEILYNYDFGDNWIVSITKLDNCDDLLKEKLISKVELEAAKDTVISKHKPVCIYKEGISLIDDVGNLHGFADFLETIYEEEDKEETRDAKAWAKMMGWTDKKISNKKML